MKKKTDKIIRFLAVLLCLALLMPMGQADAAEEEGSYEFPLPGYIWGKDVEKTDLGIKAVIRDQVSLRSTVGSSVTIQPGVSHSYGNWGSHEFHITTSAGESLGYCVQPMLTAPEGTYQVSELEHDLIKAALIIAPGGEEEMYENYGKDLYTGGDGDTYAYAHALISYLYGGSLYGLTDEMAEKVQKMASTLTQLCQNPQNPAYEIFQKYMGQYQVYIAYTGSDDLQDIVWLEKNPTGYAKLKKESADVQITGDNVCYSLAGAKYGVYKDHGCSQLAGTLTTNADGESEVISLEQGNYYVKEIEAPKGYVLDTEIYSLKVTALKATVLSVSDQPVAASAEIEFEKIDKETGSSSAQGLASLENARFLISFYDGYFDRDDLPDTATRSWILRTYAVTGSDSEEHYLARIEEQYFIDGDEFYTVGGNSVLPLGTISIEEIQAPEGYLLEGAVISVAGETKRVQGKYVTQIRQEGNQAVLCHDSMQDKQGADAAAETENRYHIADQVIRGDFELTKIDEDTQEPMEGVQFCITSRTTGESHTFTTDANGHYSSGTDYAAHSYHTNGGNVGDGLWFGITADGSEAPVDDKLGALPYDTYLLEELECDANQGKRLYSGTISITRNQYMVNLGNIENMDISIWTTAKDEDTGTHYAQADKEVTIIDAVSYTGLRKGQTYQMTGTLMNRDTGTVVKDPSGEPVIVTKEFVPKASKGEMEMELCFDASGLEGADVVVFEELYLKEKIIAEHTDINDSSQTVHFPAIHTSASDQKTGCGLSRAEEDIVIVDTVSYENLQVGKKYRVTGILMDRDTGEAVRDPSGKEICSETEFTAEAASGTVEVLFRFDGSDMEGKTLVVFETLKRGEKEYAVHKDLKDEAQTIYIPRIRTLAMEKESQEKEVIAKGTVTLTDRVEYENLIPGKRYVITGILMDKSSGQPLVIGEKTVTSKRSFIPQETSGNIEVEFTFDAEKVGEKELVVFENMSVMVPKEETESKEEDNLIEREVASHEDLEDERQTVAFHIPQEASSPSTVKTGDSTTILGCIFVSVFMLLLIMIIIRWKKHGTHSL